MNRFVRIFTPALLLVTGACTSSPGEADAPPGDNAVAYSWQGECCFVTAARTPYDSEASCREAFLARFVTGFSHGVRGVPVSIEWMPTARGRAARHGYDCGFSAGEALARRNPRPESGRASASVDPDSLRP